MKFADMTPDEYRKAIAELTAEHERKIIRRRKAREAKAWRMKNRGLVPHVARLARTQRQP